MGAHAVDLGLGAAELPQAFAEGYGLPPLSLDRVVDKPTQGPRAWLSDPGGGRYLAKSRPDFLTPGEFAVQVGLQWAARDAGAPVQVPLATLLGNGWLQAGHRQYHLQRLVPGSAAALAADGARRLGTALGTFAKVMNGVLAFPAGDWSFPHQRHRWVPDQPAALRATTRFLRRCPGADLADLAFIEQTAERAWQACPTSELPAGFVHGDVSPLNCVFAPHGRTYLVDLDELRWAHPLFDLLQGLVTVGAFDYRRDGATTVADRWRQPRADQFLAGYLALRPLSRAEIRVAGPYLRLVLIRIVIGELDLDDPHCPAPPRLGDQVRSLCRLLAEPAPLP